MGLQAFEAVVPEPFIVGNPIPNRSQPLGNQAIAIFPTMPRFGHKTGGQQDSEMLGNGRPAHLEMAGDAIDRALAFSEQVQDLSSYGAADGTESLRLLLVGKNHGKIIGKM